MSLTVPAGAVNSPPENCYLWSDVRDIIPTELNLITGTMAYRVILSNAKRRKHGVTSLWLCTRQEQLFYQAETIDENGRLDTVTIDAKTGNRKVKDLELCLSKCGWCIPANQPHCKRINNACDLSCSAKY